MDTRSQPTGSTCTGDDIRPMLSLCERCLHRGDYITCRDIAVRAQIANPTHTAPVQILAICSVLAAYGSGPVSGSRPDWYSILNLPKFTQDQSAIKENYLLLSELLNPTKNPFPMAAKAHEWLTKAWVILCEPSIKALIDSELMMEEKGVRKEKRETLFWTRCPKCGYFYEYEKTIMDCLLRCPNVKCRDTFKAKELSELNAPPAEVSNRKVYVCYGFAPAGIDGEREGGGRGGWRWWASPFLSLRSGKNPSDAIEEERAGNAKGNDDVSDNVKQDKDVVQAQTLVEFSGSSGIVNVEKEKVINVGAEKENNVGGKVVKKRTKMMARTIKKMAGRGIRVNMNDLFSKKSKKVVYF